ncbi:sigma-70 family RNA polymerase sigma factor [Reyranella sp.]|uniref:sigma-70 family RNA polymerase sigma factor n=1 Tax=Reyranella sp. TaxID=1929291 RepID=UPI00273061B4|nr:sigma-70 family RNA polymerase sigma factor [Reyranella sp.]MDP2374402.1 sigma-70 family RNA polymerase sigma factor [Reyranella sp.]
MSVDEVRTAIDHLTADEMLKLHLIERRLLGGTGMSKGDLVHEAICKALLGARQWPRNEPVMACIVMTMKSLASHARDTERSAQEAEPEVALMTPPVTPTPDASLAQSDRKAAIEAINAALTGDEEAQLVLLGWADSLRGKPLRDLVGCDQAALDYAIKRVRQKAMILYPDGCPL